MEASRDSGSTETWGSVDMDGRGGCSGTTTRAQEAKRTNDAAVVLRKLYLGAKVPVRI